MSSLYQIKASVKLQQKIRKAHLTVRQMVFADLLAIGYEAKDAYQICGLYDTVLSIPENWKRMRSLVETNEAFNNYIPAFAANTANATINAIKAPTKKKKEEREDALVKSVPGSASSVSPDAPAPSIHEVSDEEMAELLSKENQLKALLWKLKYGNLDDKTEMDVRKMVADLTNVKKEQTQAEEKRTVFYLPLKCSKCSLYQKAQAKRSVKEG